jgi:glycosyltransferase involved in cell wall biosynthesis
MKLALCLEYPIEQPGGTEVLVRELIHGLAARHQIVLVSGDSAESLRASSVADKIVAHLPWDLTAVTQGKSRALAAALHAQKIDLAHFHFGGNYAWGNRLFNVCPVIHLDRLGTPCLATNHGVFGLWEGYIGAQRPWFVKAALLPPAWASKMQMLAHLRAEIAVSQADWRTLRRRYWPARGKFLQIYHSRIQEQESMPEGARKKIILCAGTLGPRKGQPYLARAFAQIANQFPEWKLIFIGRPGDAQTTAELEELLRGPALREQAEWRSACSDTELRAWLASAEIFAMPSMHEGLGLSLQEALYAGCACLATRIGGIPDLIQDGENGMLVERANVNEMSNALKQLMSDDALRNRFRARARASVLEKDMTAPRMVARHEELYRALLAR